MPDLDRQTLFENERFIIGVVQVVSGASIAAALNQFGAIAPVVGTTALRVFITLATLALVLAVLAALFRHDYKKWDVKAQIAASQNRTWEVKERGRKAEFYLDTMRRSIYAAVGVLCGAFVVLTVALWV